MKTILLIAAYLLCSQPLRAQAAIDPVESLRGKTSMSIYISIEGIRDIPETVFRSDIAEELTKAGITILPQSDPPKFPLVRLKVDAILGRLCGSTPFSIYTLDVEFRELFRVSSTGPPKFVRATTWSNHTYGAIPAIRALEIRSDARKLVRTFTETYLSVNSSSPPAASAGPAPEVANSTSARPLASSKVNTLYLGVVGSLFDVPANKRELARSQIEELMKAGQKVITCSYGDPKNGYNGYDFWYPSAPPNVAALIDSAPNHPLSQLGFAAVDRCPATGEAAAARKRSALP
jgi:hypothetical protein